MIILLMLLALAPGQQDRATIQLVGEYLEMTGVHPNEVLLFAVRCQVPNGGVFMICFAKGAVARQLCDAQTGDRIAVWGRLGIKWKFGPGIHTVVIVRKANWTSRKEADND